MADPIIPNPDRPAFPTEYSPQMAALRGLTKREHFAGLALAGLLANNERPNDDQTFDEFVVAVTAASVGYADALLARLGEPTR